MATELLDNAETGDAHVGLVLVPQRDCLSRSDLTDLHPALATNGGWLGLDVSGQGGPDDGVSAADAARALGCAPAEIRAAIQTALPDATYWDWGSDWDEEIGEAAEPKEDD